MPDLVELLLSNVNIVERLIFTNDGVVAEIIKLLQHGQNKKLWSQVDS